MCVCVHYVVLTFVRNKNSMVRSENSVVVRPEMELVPLYSVMTGEVVSNCPGTLADLESLNGMFSRWREICVLCLQCFATASAATALLRSLGESVPRGLDEKRRMLKLAFGVRTRAV